MKYARKAVTVKESSHGYQPLEVDSLHLANGTIFVTGEINDELVNDVISQLLYLKREKIPVKMIINTPGGSVTAGLALYDVIREFRADITMFCMGIAASMGAVLLAAGEKGKRYILPHSKVMIHEPLLSGGISGPTSTIRKTAEDMIETKRIINGILAECTGKTIKQIDKATAFDNFMSAKEAIDFGLCDKIITSFELSQLTVKHKI